MEDSTTPVSAWLTFSLGVPACTRVCEHLRLATPEPSAVGAMIQQFLNSRNGPLVELLSDAVPLKMLERQFSRSTLRKVQRALEWERSSSAHHLLGLDHPCYPQLLQNTAHAPTLLYAKGDLAALSRPQLAIVGSRKASHSALAHTRQIARSLASRGMGIVSGLALGIDAAAHEGALDAGGITIAVAATEPQAVYPKRHADLEQRIVDAGGLIITENPIGRPTKPWFFPLRNRIISGMSHGVLVAEAGMPSGTMTTAVHAMGQGREVMAVPGSVHNLQTRGCHALIKQGAALIENCEDVIDVLGSDIRSLLETGVARDRASRAAQMIDEVSAQGRLDLDDGELSRDEQTVLNCLATQPVSLDELMGQTDFTIPYLSSMLGSLEIRGIICTVSGGRYSRC